MKNNDTVLTVIPLDKFKRYNNYCKKTSGTIICDECGTVTEGKLYPYGYDAQNNDVYFATECQKCGKIYITKE